MVRTYSQNQPLVERKRKLIVEQARRMFCEKGYNNTNIREIAEACNMSTGAIYRYIGSKEDIIHLLVVAHIGIMTGKLQSYYEKLEKANPVRTFKLCLAEFFRLCDWDQDFLMFINREMVYFPKQDRNTLLNNHSRDINLFQSILEEGVQSGHFKAHDTFLMAQNIVLFGHGWILRRWYLRARYSLREYIKKQTEAVLGSILADESREDAIPLKRRAS
jgi:AcrR family transcriptional regulator